MVPSLIFRLMSSLAFTPGNGLPGRTYFLGAFISQSVGSTYLSDAGLWQSSAAATGEWKPYSTAPSDYAGGKLVITAVNPTNGGEPHRHP